MIPKIETFLVVFYTCDFSSLPRSVLLGKKQVRFGREWASMVACYSMVTAVLVKKPVMVGKRR